METIAETAVGTVPWLLDENSIIAAIVCVVMIAVCGSLAAFINKFWAKALCMIACVALLIVPGWCTLQLAKMAQSCAQTIAGYSGAACAVNPL